MTTLNKPIRRVLPRIHDLRGRKWIVRIAEHGIEIKLEGQRWSSAVTAPWDAIYKVALRHKALESARAREQARKERKALRLQKAAGV